MSENRGRILSVDLGRTDYKSTWDLQKRLVDQRHKEEIPDVLLFTEHNPVITLGRASSSKNILCSPEELKKRNVELYEIERGGDVTFHGPGQMVVYPIIDLNSHGRDLHKYLRDLERVIIRVLEKYGIDASTKEGLTGVWSGDRKLAAIGVAVSKWITYHGLALNVNTDLDYFTLINPCGITQYPVGSMQSMLGRKIRMGDLKRDIDESFGAVFNCRVEPVDSIDSIISEPVGYE